LQENICKVIHSLYGTKLTVPTAVSISVPARSVCSGSTTLQPHTQSHWKPRNRPTPSGKSTSQPPHGSPDQECVTSILLNAHYTVIGWNLVSLGTLTKSIAPREVLRPCVAANAYAFVQRALRADPISDMGFCLGGKSYLRSTRETASFAAYPSAEASSVSDARNDCNMRAGFGLNFREGPERRRR
jgi:hypothetical protein